MSTAAPLCELPVQLHFSDEERDALAAALLAVEPNPYTAYPDFMAAVADVARTGPVPDALAALCDELRASDPRERPFTVMQNCPIDDERPVFDFDEPVEHKRRVKRTFVAEGFLALFAELRGTPPIGYINVNDGDVFQDIYPKRALAGSQSQKALGEIYFHKDLANHFVRPDYVNMLSMRADPANRIFTCFVRNLDAIERLDDATLEVLRMPRFHTPFDDLTVAGGRIELGDADVHPILSGDLDLRYFEIRTHGLDEEAQRAAERLAEVLHELKARVMLMPGDFMSEHNNYSIHCKEVQRVEDPETQRVRWIIKTVNVERLEDHAEAFLPGRPGIVAG